MDMAWYQKYRAIPESQRAKMRKIKGRGSAILIRYADDFLVLTNGNQTQAEEIKEEFRQILERLGLRLSAAKTLVTHVNDGFDFLGFHCQRQRVPQHAGRYALYVTPTEKNVERLKEKVRDILTTNYEDAANKIRAVNAVVRGWCNYYRHVASYDARAALDHWLWWQMLRWFWRKHNRELTATQLYDRYIKRDRKGWKGWSCEGVFLIKPVRDIPFRIYTMRTIPHPYLEPTVSLTIQDEQPVPDADVWSGHSAQNRYAVARLKRMREVRYCCEHCHRGPFPITELDAHHPSGKHDGTWHDLVVVCRDCHKQTASYGVNLANQTPGEPDALKGARPVRRRGKTHGLSD
jgi:hypothetical protein